MPTKITIATFDEKHKENLAKRARKVKRLYDAAVKQIAQAAAPSLFDADKDKEFHFEDFPALKKEMDALMQDLGASLQTNIEEGDDESWTLSNTKNDAMVDSIIGKAQLPSKTVQSWKHPHLEALDAFIDRKEAGMELSKRVWNLTEQFKGEMELALELGMGEGKSAAELSRDIRKYLVHPDKLFRRVRDKSGALRLSKAAAAYHPGRGVYRSSYKNALRMTATENNMAYRTADHKRWSALPFVLGIEIRISNNHPIPDICDELAGRYPVDFKFTGWHPWCRCYAVSILAKQEEMDAYTKALINGEDVSDWQFTGKVEEMPTEFTKWMKDNESRIANAKTMPYFIKDNFKDGDPTKGLRWEGKTPDHETKPAKTKHENIPGNQKEQIAEFGTMDKKEAIKEIMSQAKVDADMADFMYESIRDFSFGAYQDMRTVQMGGTDIWDLRHSVKEWKQRVEACEEFIEKSPKWNGGSTYRGMHVSEEQMQALLNKMEKKEPIDMQGIASWSTSKDIALGYTYPNPKTPIRVILETDDAQNGTSIAHISIHPGEHEILCSVRNKYVIKEITKVQEAGFDYYKVKVENTAQLNQPAIVKKPTAKEIAAKRHAARTKEQAKDIQDAWTERRLDFYDEQCDKLMKTLTYSQGQALPALAKRQVALRNAIGKKASVSDIESLFNRFEAGVKAQREWDNQVWGGFTQEQIANMKDIEKKLGIKKGRPMTYEEADKQNANPNHVEEFIRVNGRLKKNPKYDKTRDEPYEINCQTCAPAYALRLKGFNLCAKGNTKGSLSDWISHQRSFEIWENQDGTPVKPVLTADWMKQNGFTFMTPNRYKKYFEETCKDEGVYVLTIGWKGGGGHATIIQRFADGTLSYIEPQVYDGHNARQDMKELYNYGARNPTGKRGILRVDDKIFKNKFLSIFDK